MDFDAVRRIGCTFPGVELGLTFGRPALKIGGKMFVCAPSHRSSEPDSLVVRMPFDRRDELLAEAPDIYYLPDHYVGYASVLVRLRKISPDALRGLLAGALQFVEKPPPKRSRRKSARR
jgi:hypothetical protein